MNKQTKITPEEVKHIAKLANLPVKEEDLQKYGRQLGDILDLVGKLQSVNTNNIEPTSQVTGLINIFREDIVKPSLSQEEALKNAPKSHNGYFVTDAVFES